jgi:hypothetical protein
MCADTAAMQWSADFKAHKAKPTNTEPGIIYIVVFDIICRRSFGVICRTCHDVFLALQSTSRAEIADSPRNRPNHSLLAPRSGSRSRCHHRSKALKRSLTPDSGKRFTTNNFQSYRLRLTRNMR